MSQTVEDIQKKIDNNTAEIMTASELKTLLSDGEKIDSSDVDVVTTGTCGVMSGTTAVLHLPVSEAGTFQKAKKIYLNGIEAYPGPCPNEWLSSVDLIIYGTNHSNTIKNYGGGFLLHDLIKGKDISVIVIDTEDNSFESIVSIKDIPYARMIGTRNAFKNYTAFTNPSTEGRVKSIFNAVPMIGSYKNLSFSGCGDINPLANDPNQEVIKTGTKMLLNGSEGLVIDNGTRSTKEKPNLMLTADIKQMNDYYLGGFKTGMGPEIFNTVAIPIPILNDSIMNNLKILNKNISLPLSDIHGRHLPIDTIDYSLWDNSDLRPNLDIEKCHNCLNCIPLISCPTNAFKKDKSIDTTLCYGCGYCKYACSYDTINIKLNHVTIDIDGTNTKIPVTCRQSDKKRADLLSIDLKNKIIDNKFNL